MKESSQTQYSHSTTQTLPTAHDNYIEFTVRIEPIGVYWLCQSNQDLINQNRDILPLCSVCT